MSDAVPPNDGVNVAMSLLAAAAQGDPFQVASSVVSARHQY